MKGIIFSAAMVNAILKGAKTQTRRIIKPQPVPDWIRPCVGSDGVAHGYCGSGPEQGIKSRYRRGETIYVKEQWTLNTEGQVIYLADWEEGSNQKYGMGWRSPLFMPESASRIKLTITNVRIERVQDISADDCIAEGVWPEEYTQCERNWLGKWHSQWVAIHGEASWDKNPWVWVISFKQVTV